MEVEATYRNLLASHHQLFTNRESNNNHQQQQQQHHQLLYSGMYNNAQMDDSTAMLLPGKMAQSFMPFYQFNNVCDPKKAESGLTCHNNINIPLHRKRQRDFNTDELTSLQVHQKNKLLHQSSFIDQGVLYQIQNQQQCEIERVFAHHAEKVRMGLQEQKMRQSTMLLGTIEEAMAKKLKEKDEEFQRIDKLNMTLQERIKSLWVENQIWMKLAQTNETTANYLRNNLEQLLAHVGGKDHHHNLSAVADDAQSSCASNGVAEAGDDTAASVAVGGGRSKCKNCGVRESIVLLLPCKHLCLCTNCGSFIHNCPVCDSRIDASVNVNLSY